MEFNRSNVQSMNINYELSANKLTITIIKTNQNELTTSIINPNESIFNLFLNTMRCSTAAITDEKESKQPKHGKEQDELPYNVEPLFDYLNECFDEDDYSYVESPKTIECDMNTYSVHSIKNK